MNNFPFAYGLLVKTEGGYVNDPADPGGETYAGISRRYYPTWDGWPNLDAIPNKTKNQFYRSLDDKVKNFYYAEKWAKYGFDRLDDPDIAAAALDTVVNHGKGPYIIQDALQRAGKSVTVDGRIGPATLSLLNTTPAKTYLPALYDARAAYYKGLVLDNPDLAKFLPGWLTRIDKWKGVATGGFFFTLSMIALGAYYVFRKKSNR